MSDDAEHADDAERAQARALADALEGQSAGEPPPGDAFETALLLRHAGPRGELDPARGEAILHGLLRGGMPSPRPWRRVAASFAIGLAAAAGLALGWFGITTALSPAAHPVRSIATHRLPVPSPSLLAAQSALVKSAPGDAARFEREMRAYREQLWKTLEAAYPAPVSALEPARRRQQ